MNANEFYSLGKRRSVCDLRQRTAHYAGSWLAVHLLQLGDPTLSGRFQTDLTRLARGDDENKAWAGSFAGVDVASRYQGYLDVRYEMGGRAVSIAAPRRPMVHLMSQVDAALLRARLYAWRSEEGAKAALEYLDLAASKDPSASNVMLHKAALQLEAGRNREGWAWLDRAIEQASADPQVAATAILWFASRDGAASERARLDAWAQTLRVSAQTAFRPAALGEYFVRVAGDPRSGFDSLQRSLTLDATSWRTYALIGDALGEVAENMRRDFRSIDTRTARIILLDFADRVLVSFDRDLSERAKQDLESLGVEVLLGTRVHRPGRQRPDRRDPRRFDSDRREQRDLGGRRQRRSFGGDSRCRARPGGGRVLVGEDLSIEGHPNVFVAGDMAHRLDAQTGQAVPAVAQGAIQGGKFVGETIAAELEALRKGESAPTRKAFQYEDRGSMAIIGRNRAVAQIGKLRFGGYFAFVMWALIHILFLIDFRRKLVVFVEWTWLYFTGGRGARLITGDDRMPKVIQPPPDFRAKLRESRPHAPN